ncbi:MAG: hypothetical protein IKH98_04880 [Candidatus Methanomethylophilaceae archaeon]|nr:hypothetical protein [Candidatus Methanomethylophilaceae archaeon]
MVDVSARKSAHRLVCDRCGTSVDPEECYNSMGTDPLILCPECHAKVSAAWAEMKDDAEARKTFVIDTLCDGPASSAFLTVVPKFKETLRALSKEGYIVYESDGMYRLSGSPELRSFSKSLSMCSTAEDAEWIRDEYSGHWRWLCASYCEC